MICIQCECGVELQLPVEAIGQLAECSECHRDIRLVAAEGAGARDWTGDFVTRLTVEKGPDRAREQIFLGGEGPIGIGKLDGKHIQLIAPMVSRNHCKLVQVGKGAWRVFDENSKNGLFVNGNRVQRHDLAHGDLLRVGDYEFRYRTHRESAEDLPPPPHMADIELPPLPPLPPPVPVAAKAASAAAADDDLYDLAAPEPVKAAMPAAPVFMPRGLAAKDAPRRAVQQHVPMDGPICPSCDQNIARGGKICITCGIQVPSGRPLLIHKGLDEDALAVRADTWIRILSWILPLGLFPVASEAFGTRKPYATWSITAATILASVLFIIVAMSTNSANLQLANMMLWTGEPPKTEREDVDPPKANVPAKPPAPAAAQARPQRRNAAPAPVVPDDPDKTAADDDDEVSQEELDALMAEMEEMDDEDAEAAVEMITAIQTGEVGFRWYQLITHAFLHDPSGPIQMLFHLAGNMLFLLVFGTRVNELIGNIAFAIVYPVLIVASALVQMASMQGELSYCVGASGAVMGLAGMYFVFFPIHRVHTAIWIRLRRFLAYKLFKMPGFWLLVLWVGWNDVLPMFVFKSRDGVGHWAHLGGFATGMLIAVGLMVARLTTARGGDILSYTLGRHAWPLIGRPSRWRQEQPVAVG